MTPPGIGLSRQTLLLFFALFAFFSAFSIAASQMALGLSLVLYLIIKVKDRDPSVPRPLCWIYWLIALYVGWLFITALAGATPLRSIMILKEEWLFLIIPIGLLLFRDEKHAERLMLSLGAGLIVASLYGVYRFLIDVFWKAPEVNEAGEELVYQLSGFFSHPLTFGNYMAVASLFLVGFLASFWKRLSGWKRTLLLTSTILSILSTGLCNTRGPVLALAVGLIVAGFLFGKVRLVLPVLVVVILVGSVSSGGIIQRFSERYHVDTQLRYEGGRFFIWNNSLKIIADHPFLGVGQGNFAGEYVKVLRPDIGEHRKLTHAHSDYLNTAVIAGIPGLLLYLAVWGTVLFYLWRATRAVRFPAFGRGLSTGAFLATVGFMVCSLTEAAFADEEVRQLMMFFWAAGLSVWYNIEDISKEDLGAHKS